ncbi:MAG: hypothetical protein ABWY27_05740 [Telluria sp.]
MYRMSLLLLSTHCMAVPAALAVTPVAISFAEQPVRLLRDKSFYLTGRGAQLQNGDIVESGSGSIQINGGGSATLALGPASRLHVRIAARGTDYLLLEGWLKIQARAASDGASVSVSSPGTRIDLAASSVILHASSGNTGLFVESGQPAVEELRAGKAPRRAAVGREQYAVAGAGQPLKVMPRAPREFLGAMPPAFFDALVPVAAKGAAVAPKLERAATFADIAPWLAHHPELRQTIYRRFHPPKPAPAAPRRPTPTIAKDPS